MHKSEVITDIYLATDICLVTGLFLVTDICLVTDFFLVVGPPELCSLCSLRVFLPASQGSISTSFRRTVLVPPVQVPLLVQPVPVYFASSFRFLFQFMHLLQLKIRRLRHHSARATSRPSHSSLADRQPTLIFHGIQCIAYWGRLAQTQESFL